MKYTGSTCSSNAFHHKQTLHKKLELSRGQPVADEDVTRLSPLGYEHLNFLGRFSFELAEPIAQGGWRPLRQPESAR